MKTVAIIAVVLIVSGVVRGQEITKADGGSIQTNTLNWDTILNEGSTLRREWVGVHGNMPLAISGTPGVRTIHEGIHEGSHLYTYTAKATVTAHPTKDVTAFEIRFAIFSVFGERMTTLSATEIEDIPAGEQRTFDFKWIAQENDVSRFFASVAFVALVRTGDGQVHKADYETVLNAVREFKKEATEADLDPSADKPSIIHSL